MIKEMLLVLLFAVVSHLESPRVGPTLANQYLVARNSNHVTTLAELP